MHPHPAYAVHGAAALGACLLMAATPASLAATAPLSIQRTSASEVELSWFGISGLSYQLQSNPDLGAEWDNLEKPVSGANAMVKISVPIAGIPRLFFRLEPPPADTITAVFVPATGILTVTGGDLANTIVLVRDASGVIRINGGGVSITGGIPTITNTNRIDILGREGADEILLDESQGALPPARIFGEGGNDTLTGGSGADFIDGGLGNDSLHGRGGADNLTGGDGRDSLTGGDANDQLSGGNHDDSIIWNPGDDTDLCEGDGGTDTIEVNGGSGAEIFSASVPASRVRFDRVNPAPFSLDIGTAERLVLNANSGDDAFSASGNIAPLIAITVNGGAGMDNLSGSNGADILNGGDDNDFIDGQQGNDTLFGGNDNDTIQWDPGDGNDVMEGQGGQDILVFNASNAGETISLTANGSRVTLLRNVGSVSQDLNDVETLDLNLLGGADILTVNNLAGTDLTTVIADLAGSGGAGDSTADSITLNGTAAPDIVSVTATAPQITVTGLPATVHLLQSESANDHLTINGLGGADTFGIGPGVSSLIGVTTND